MSPDPNIVHRVAVVVAHPDDEVLGCGGTIRRHILAGDEVWVVVLADGETGRRGSSGDKVVAAREAAAHAAAKILGVPHLALHRFADNRLDARPLLDLVQVLEEHIREISPDTVYTHHAGDLNIDHRRTHEAILTACRPQSGHPVKRLLAFEIPSSTEWQQPSGEVAFCPNWFVDISSTLENKMLALKAYSEEMRPWPHPRSYQGVEHLARWRGAIVGCDAAEAFMLMREIRR
ncbi:MAG TPA: PIG-L family deacetylase [Xanthobacteraceae bacterium]|jgi:LmbE family N-acetylglucosaminyl deacetylase